MAVVLPFILVGAPIGYFTWTGVFETVDRQVSQLISPQTPDSSVTSPSGVGAVCGVLGSSVVLTKVLLGSSTRHRLFFGPPPPNTSLRMATLYKGFEFLLRSAGIFYGAAAVGATTGRLAVSLRDKKIK
ncbi:hypothetical protein J3Q64DRAFT_1680725 [Phycomyces blakesleeanus]|uniref:Uncharacterized protein n=2 Tax=Phycomyces blakesleeanus TaxID=4837 RepID=A0A163DE07_PHYB8|nr:hypothetical protein PHYBLDRAFT_171365 [Phycomyces blakesleeanus NRRL 1555(-)]OAD70620.1 hypothetical protein PHYBLDRAFT_171365 [Phycomyces blakesleeanus NRRL 1555(-)]|eukprot:XP_018288660.1 hypothetical protein PHYBLDRAFT_171365 [Phycomyces blakesleeanus NRRL 1555(-)]